MREVSSTELKQLAVNILSEIDSICRSNSIRYTLIFGTLLGAVRHKGFIPWDDDVDIAMPRPDYKRFVEYCRDNKTTFGFISSECSHTYGRLFAKAYDQTTRLDINDSSLVDNHVGVYVDIFPVDGFGDSIEEAESIYDKTAIYRGLLNARCWRKFIKSKTHKWYHEPLRFCAFVVSRFISMRKLVEKIDSVTNSLSFENSKFASILSSAYRKKDIIEKSVYENYIDIEFEGHSFKCIRDFDHYLSHVYGDYMKLPPVEKRATHHIFTAYYQ